MPGVTGENLAFTFNTDGSIDIPVDNKDTRFVKESDLLVVKSAKEKAEGDLGNATATFNTDLAEANRVKDETHQQLLQSQAANEQLKTSQSDHDTLKTRVGELETEVGSHKESVGNFETELANRIRHNLITYHGATEEALKDKDLSQLRNVEEAAKIFTDGKGKVVPAAYDGGAGGAAAGSVPETSLERAQRILEEHDRKRGKVPA